MPKISKSDRMIRIIKKLEKEINYPTLFILDDNEDKSNEIQFFFNYKNDNYGLAVAKDAFKDDQWEDLIVEEFKNFIKKHHHEIVADMI